MGKLAGKVAVVTGASKGIGAAIAQQLAREGAAIVVNYASSSGAAEKIVAGITESRGRAIAIKADVAKAADVEHLFAETKKTFGKLDILVNNAGVYKFGTLEQFTHEEFHRQFNINVLGLLLVTHEAVKLFGEHGGSIIQHRIHCIVLHSRRQLHLHGHQSRRRRHHERSRQRARV
jgi:3-oxoacyl-[acyl-carrier protein] reductase